MSSQTRRTTALCIQPILEFLHGGHYLSMGYKLSIPKGQYKSIPDGYLIESVQTVFETRRQRLKMLVGKYGSVAQLNRALGWEETNARLYQIHNRSVRKDRGTLYEMGDPTAREIEERLSLQEGWMDTPPNYSEMHQDDRITHVMRVMESMPEWKRDQAMRLIDTIAEPAPKLGNGD